MAEAPDGSATDRLGAVVLTGGSGSGDSSSLIKGGGQVLTRTNGSVKRGEIESQSRSYNLQALKSEVEAADAAKMKELQRRMEAAIAANPRLDRWFVQDLNHEPTLLLDEGTFDAALCCVGAHICNGR